MTIRYCKKCNRKIDLAEEDVYYRIEEYKQEQYCKECAEEIGWFKDKEV